MNHWLVMVYNIYHCIDLNFRFFKIYSKFMNLE